jgi:hypothetical protein
MRTEADRIEVDPHHGGDGLTQARAPRFGVLMLAMLAELTLAPFLVMATGTLMIARWVGAIVLLAALSVAGSHRVAVGLFSGALIFHLAAMVSETTFVGAAAELFRLLFLGYVLGLIVWRVVRDRVVTFDTVAGAACAYFLLGVVWGELFLLVDRWRPGSFAIPAGWTAGPGRDLRSALMYFSFATLTTVGYGDIHPTDPAAGSLCVAEALIGQLYLAIMIARMVGLHTSQRQ